MLHARHSRSPWKPRRLRTDLSMPWSEARKHRAQLHSQLLFTTKATLGYVELNSAENTLLEGRGRGQETMLHHLLFSNLVYQAGFICTKHRAEDFLHTVGTK